MLDFAKAGDYGRRRGLIQDETHWVGAMEISLVLKQGRPSHSHDPIRGSRQ